MRLQRLRRPRVALLDTSLNTDNEGDRIIVSSIVREFPDLAPLPRFPTHRFLRLRELLAAYTFDYLLLTGTNALTSTPSPARPWRLGPKEMLAYSGKVIPIGVGFRSYEGEVSPAMARAYRKLFAPGLPVSVRDSYAHARLENVGIASQNTSCPTLWSLPDRLPEHKAVNEVVTTVTDYAPMQTKDEFLFDTLSRRFSSVLIWPQGVADPQYLAQLRKPANARVIEPGLESFERALAGRAYVGTRLHAGVRAAQLGHPVLVIAVDGRALEIGKDTSFPVLLREELEQKLGPSISSLWDSRDLSMPRDVIASWRAAFGGMTGIEN